MTLPLAPAAVGSLPLTSGNSLAGKWVVWPAPSGDTSGASDYAAIQPLLNTAPQGNATAVLHIVPPGAYYFSQHLAIPYTVKLLGAGAGSADHLLSAATRLIFTSTTDDGLVIAAGGCTIEDVAILNNSGAEVSGAGIRITSGSYMRLNRVGVRGFYDNLSIDVAIYYQVEACHFLNAIRYGVRVRNTTVADAGDGFIGSGTVIYPRNTGATSAIRWESGGGLKIEGVKININGAGEFAIGVDAAIADAAATSVFLVEGCSIENCSTIGVSVSQQGTTGIFGKVIITGNEFGPGGTIPTAVSVVSTTVGDITDVIINDNLIFATTNGIAIDGANRVTIGGNEINGTFADSGISIKNVAGGTIAPNTIYGQFINAAVTIKSSATPSSAIAVDHQNVITTGGVQTLVLDSSAGVASHLARNRIVYDETREIPGGIGNVTYVNMYQFLLPANLGVGGVLEFSIEGKVTGGGGDAFAIYGKRLVTLGSGGGATPTLATIGADVTAGTTIDYTLDTATAGTVKLQIRLNAAQGGTDFTGQVRVKYDGPLTRLIKQ